MSYLEQNLKALEEKDIKLYEAVCHYEKINRHVKSVETIEAKDGNLILQVNCQDKLWTLNSTYHPLAEGERFAEQYKTVKEKSVLLLFGFGNGILPRAICKKLGNGVSFIFYEPSPEIFFHVMEHYDISDLLSMNNLAVFVEDFNTDEFKVCIESQIDYMNYMLFIMDSLPKYKTLFPQAYETVYEAYRYRIEYVKADAYTTKLLGHLTVENNIQNLKYLPDSNCCEDFLGVFPKEMPAIIVGAGPSLEKNIHVLKKAKNRALIVAVDSAIPYLMKYDIMPDILVALDPRKSLDLFADKRLKDIPFAVHTDLSYKVLDKVKTNRVIFATTTNPYYSKLYELAGKKLYQLPSGGSVATLAYGLCITWGFQRVILIGQDLAMTGNQVHVGEEKFTVDTFQRELIPVDGIDGETVYTTKDFYYYLEWFHMAVEYYKDVEVIDATEGGAKIKGTLIMTLEEALDAYCQQEYDISGMIHGVQPAFSNEQKADLYQCLLDSKSCFSKLKREIKEGCNLAERGVTLVKRGKYDPKELANIGKRLDQICKDFENAPEAFLLEREADSREIDLFQDLYDAKENQEDERTRLFEKMQAYYKGLAGAADVVLPLFEQVTEELTRRFA